MNDRVKKVLARPEVLMMGPVTSPVTGHRFPIYTAAKKIYTYPDTLHVLGEELGVLVKAIDGTKVVGGETVGIVLATAVSMAINIPMCYARKEPRTPPRYGVEGIISSGEKVVLIDDSLVSGKTKEMFIKNIEAMGAIVSDIVVVVNVPSMSGDQYRANLAEKGIRLHALCLWEEWFTSLYEYGHLSKEMYEIALDCARNIDSWKEGAPQSKEKWAWFEKSPRKTK